jgi:hypothetical protein
VRVRVRQRRTGGGREGRYGEDGVRDRNGIRREGEKEER